MGKVLALPRPKLAWEVPQQSLLELDELIRSRNAGLKLLDEIVSEIRELEREEEQLASQIKSNLLKQGRVEPGDFRVELQEGELVLGMRCDAASAVGD